MLAPMSKIEIVGARSLMQEIIEEIQASGVVHLRETPLPESEEEAAIKRAELSGQEAADARKLGDAMERLNELLASMPRQMNSSPTPERAQRSADDILESTMVLSESFRSLRKTAAELRDELSLLVKYEEIVASLIPVLEEEGFKHRYDLFGLVVFRRSRAVLDLLSEELSRITDDVFKLISSQADRDRIVAVVGVPPEFSDEVRELIGSEGISEIRLPEDFRGRPLAEALALLRSRLGMLPSELDDARSKSEDFFREHASGIVSLAGECQNRLARMNVVTSFARSRYTFVVSGWLPKEDIPGLRQRLKTRFGKRALINELSVRKKEFHEVPVKLRNPKFIRPFEALLVLFPPAKYGSIDATVFMAIFFPIFFGMILGDIFYGVCVFGVAMLLRWKSRPNTFLRSISSVFLFCAFYSTLFGFLFGEFLGDMGHTIGLHPIILNRETAIMPMLIAAIAVGAVHVFLGIFLNLYHAIREREKKEIIGEAGLVLTLLSVFALIGRVTGVVPSVVGTVATIVFVPAFAALIYGHSFMGPLEVIKISGNILSYARIMAIGLSSVILAVVANDLRAEAGNPVMGLFIAFAIHTINLALGMFGPTIHSLRLHYVEFFSRFYKPEGREYRPFSEVEVSK